MTIIYVHKKGVRIIPEHLSTSRADVKPRMALNEAYAMTSGAREFHFKGWDLLDAIDALQSYDQGARDAGVFDLELRKAVVLHLNELDADLLRKVLAEYARCFLTDEAILAGYGLDDVCKFVEWLNDVDITIR